MLLLEWLGNRSVARIMRVPSIGKGAQPALAIELDDHVRDTIPPRYILAASNVAQSGLFHLNDPLRSSRRHPTFPNPFLA